VRADSCQRSLTRVGGPRFGPVRPAAHGRARSGLVDTYKWCWRPMGDHSTSLGFPASLADLCHCPCPRSRSPPLFANSTAPRHPSPMERDRSFSEISEANHEYELSVRCQALEYNNDHRRRERERPRSPTWCREDPRYRDDHWRFEAGSSASRGATRPRPPSATRPMLQIRFILLLRLFPLRSSPPTLRPLLLVRR
jgi:hypothetical protein